MEYPWTGFDKLDRVCILSRSQETLRNLGIDYGSDLDKLFVEALMKGSFTGRLRGIVLRSSYDEACQVLPPATQEKFVALNRCRLEEAENVAWQCEEGKRGGIDYNFIQSSRLDEDKELFFGPVTEQDLFLPVTDDMSMAHIMAQAEVFPSVSQARKNGWNKPVPAGFTDIRVGKNKVRITILKEIP